MYRVDKEYLGLISEKLELEKILENIPEEEIINKNSFTERLDVILDKIDEYDDLNVSVHKNHKHQDFE